MVVTAFLSVIVAVAPLESKLSAETVTSLANVYPDGAEVSRII